MSISLPSELLTFLAVVALIWTLASVLVVWLVLRAQLAFAREGVRRSELAQVEERLDAQHRAYVGEATDSRDRLQQTVSALSKDVHVMIGKLDAKRAT